MGIRDKIQGNTDRKQSDLDSWMAGNGGMVGAGIVLLVALAMLAKFVWDVTS